MDARDVVPAFDSAAAWARLVHAAPGTERAGARTSSELPYAEFSQVLNELLQERVRQAFNAVSGGGAIVSADKFRRIELAVAGHHLSPYVAERLTLIGDIRGHDRYAAGALRRRRAG